MINTDYAQYRAWAELEYPPIKYITKIQLIALGKGLIKSNVIVSKHTRVRGKAKL